MSVKTHSHKSGMVPLAIKWTLIMKTLWVLIAVTLMLGLPAATRADDAQLAFGGDQYEAGQTIDIATPVQRDAFAAGSDVTLTAPVSGDAHLAGFNVDVSSEVGSDLYAAGFSVKVTAAVGGDVTAAGHDVTLKSTAPITGNVRLAGSSVLIGTNVGGSALVTAQSATLEAPIAGDFSFYGENLTFGPGARVDGTLKIRAPKQIEVPASVASADQVLFELRATPDYMSAAGETAGTVVGRFWPVFWTIAAWWLVLLVLGAALIAFMPQAVKALQVASEKGPLHKLGLGILAFASVLGLVPVVAMTIIGILLLPFVLVFAVVACSLAYLAGTFLIGLRIASAFVAVDTNLKRLGVLAIALIAAAVIAMIPFLGWLMTLGILIFGFGTAAVVVMARWTPGDATRLGAVPLPTAGA
ncbi:MAG TPA: hypothetical protein VL147_18080 [Devosia sp.]|nr:hypothetical protein [Devosia sp.]